MILSTYCSDSSS